MTTRLRSDSRRGGVAETTAVRAAPGGVTRLAVGGLLGGTLAIAAAYASAFGAAGAPRWAAWAMALGVPLVLVATLTLGAAREGRLPRALVLPFALVGGLLAGGFALALGLPDDLGAAEPLWLGLPRRAAVVVYGIGLLPVLVLPVAYALTFDAQTLREEDLARVRRAGALRRGETPEAPGASERPGGPAVITPRDATLRVGA